LLGSNKLKYLKATISMKKKSERGKSFLILFSLKAFLYCFFPKKNQRYLLRRNRIQHLFWLAYNVLQLLGDMLLDRSNSAVMVRYVSSWRTWGSWWTFSGYLSLSLSLAPSPSDLPYLHTACACVCIKS